MNLGKSERESMLLKIEELIKYRYDGLYICNGHDLLKILSLLTSKEISNDNPVRYDEDIFMNLLVDTLLIHFSYLGWLRINLGV